MLSRRMSGGEPGAWSITCGPGEELISSLTTFVRSERLHCGRLTASGDVRAARLSFFDIAVRAYQHIAIDAPAEALVITGDIMIAAGGAPGLLIHAVLGLSDGSRCGGHLITAQVCTHMQVTLSGTTREISPHLVRSRSIASSRQGPIAMPRPLIDERA
jgi:predicted DNA-binding protein with PD1-like motif